MKLFKFFGRKKKQVGTDVRVDTMLEIKLKLYPDEAKFISDELSELIKRHDSVGYYRASVELDKVRKAINNELNKNQLVD